MEAFRGCYTFGHSDPWQLPQVALNSVCTTCLSQAFKGSAASMLRSHQRGHEKCPTLHSSLDCNEDTEQHNMITEATSPDMAQVPMLQSGKSLALLRCVRCCLTSQSRQLGALGCSCSALVAPYQFVGSVPTIPGQCHAQDVPLRVQHESKSIRSICKPAQSVSGKSAGLLRRQRPGLDDYSENMLQTLAELAPFVFATLCNAPHLMAA